MLNKLIVFLLLLVSAHLHAQETQLLFYQPFEEESALPVQQKLSGECVQPSQRIQREDAWRCLANGQTFDPCFAHNDKEKVVCLQSPWQKESVLIKLTKPIDNSQQKSLNMAETYPWAIELVSGEQCQAVEEGEKVEGMLVHYHCDNGSLLLGHVQRCNPEWGILQKNQQAIATAHIAKAWF